MRKRAEKPRCGIGREVKASDSEPTSILPSRLLAGRLARSSALKGAAGFDAVPIAELMVYGMKGRFCVHREPEKSAVKRELAGNRSRKPREAVTALLSADRSMRPRDGPAMEPEAGPV